jgi:hypothetical protein
MTRRGTSAQRCSVAENVSGGLRAISQNTTNPIGGVVRPAFFGAKPRTWLADSGSTFAVPVVPATSGCLRHGNSRIIRSIFW